jgi:sulfate/thiosulfate transport system substrate-binding protein
MIASCDLLDIAYADTTLLNASYEPTRRFYSDLNKAFAAHWQAEQGEKSPSISRTPVPERKRGRSLLAWRLTSSHWRSLTTSMPS